MTCSASKDFLFIVILSVLLIACAPPPEAMLIHDDHDQAEKKIINERVIRANVVALEQPLFYNRFGSVNPYGMIYTLKRDVVKVQDGEEWLPGLTCPSSVRLQEDKRPRPLVIRGNVNDVLEVTFTNELLDEQPDISNCKLVNPESPYSHLVNEADKIPSIDPLEHEQSGGDWPLTRSANIVIAGLASLSGTDPRCNGLESIQPGESVTCQWKLEREGTHLFSSHGAPAGGKGEGGSLTHGLFGVVIVEPEDSKWYRSQVSASIMDTVWQPRQGSDAIQHARQGSLDYEAVDVDGNPYLNMIKSTGRIDKEGRRIYDLIHSDLNAVVLEANSENPEVPAFREFTVIFHDELKTFYTNQFQELEESRQLSGIRDGFAINYGASGMGSILLANRKGIGPSAECVECLYEDFFLQSWANGDPALLEHFVDDPSNVHHSYLNDRIKFRNLHAGPKETHVFHLHAHQWVSSANDNSGTYLDSQTIAPQQGFDYEIYDGGLSRWGASDWHRTSGSGNRNRTPGDSIFHCHLYPHFAQGMWALWRIHDVIEDGTRKLPDGQRSINLTGNPQIALSTTRQNEKGSRTGTDPMTGLGEEGTPIPALLPLPGQGLPPLPNYGGAEGMPGYPFYIPGKPGHRAPQPPLDFAKDEGERLLHGGLPRHIFNGGERKPVFLTDEDVDRLPQDLTERANTVLRQSLALGDFRLELTHADLVLLDHEGEPLEKLAMRFHAGQSAKIRLANGELVGKDEDPGYPTIKPDGSKNNARFLVNGAAPKPGAPFADPCGAPDMVGESTNDEFTGQKMTPDPALTGFRGYEVSAIGLDLVVNRAGWHDPQARINVLTKEAENIENQRKHDMEPFFFRAVSGECIEFKHQNRTHKELELDDFQVATPTDIIGQHIHLVKFDVTSSDGSANGFNYEDGTLARDAVEERIKAANVLGGAWDQETRRKLTPGKTLDGEQIEKYQTTIQRWFADPLLTVNAEKDEMMGHAMHRPDMPCPVDREKECLDRTLRTVFTHDHFAPSSIQQHGFYSALLIEPAGAEWLRPDGSPLVDGVGSQAMIVNAKDWITHENHREFALAVADFALLYDPRLDDKPEKQGMGRLLSEAETTQQTAVGNLPESALEWLREHAESWWNQNGRPVDPPFKPEAISKDHHNPYLVNYKHEPIPLRIGQMEEKLQIPEKTECGLKAVDFDHGRPILEKRRSIASQRDGKQGDLAYVFDSFIHGDPCTPIMEAYEGEKIQIRIVQGAQEVQHTFAIEGMHWPRVIDYPSDKQLSLEQQKKLDNPLALVSAQEIGISEHFEMKIPLMEDINAGLSGRDYLYHFGSVDSLWNGAWGLIRSYNGTDVTDPESCNKEEDTDKKLTEEGQEEKREACRKILNTKNNRYKVKVGDRLKPLPNYKDDKLDTKDSESEAWKYGNGKIKIVNAAEFGNNANFVTNICPSSVQHNEFHKKFLVVATRLNLLGADSKVIYDDNHIYDPDGLILLPMPYQDSVLDPKQVKDRYSKKAMANELEPLVLRVNAGDCVTIKLVNHLALKGSDINNKSGLPDAPGDALMPKIVPLNVDDRSCMDNEPDCEKMVNIRPSTKLALSISSLPSMSTTSTLAIGQNNQEPVSEGGDKSFTLYAGRLELQPTENMKDSKGHLNCPEKEDCTFKLQPSAYAFGTVPIKAFGDVIGHGAHGLFGALIVEPEGATYHAVKSEDAFNNDSHRALEGWELGTKAIIKYEDEEGQEQQFREFVLMYQDGLNLHHWPSPWDEEGEPLPNEKMRDAAMIDNCRVCDDSYDEGEKGINYRSAPFWARLRHEKGQSGNSAAPDIGPQTNLNQILFPKNFLQETLAPIPTPIFKATEGEEVRFRVLQPHGRARQRAFVTFGHDYQDLLPEFGSPHAALLSPGKAITATVKDAKLGCYLYRDGPMQMFAGGVWGHFIVSPSDGSSLKCESPTLAKGS